jgi:hypothetical protein
METLREAGWIPFVGHDEKDFCVGVEQPLEEQES